MPVTVEQIAVHVGVAKSTVYKVLAGKTSGSYISDKRAEEIRDVAQRLGFRANSAARSMVSGRFGCAALVLAEDTVHSYLPGGLLRAMVMEFSRANLHLIISALADEKLSGHKPKILAEWMADGLIINNQYSIPPQLSELIHRFGFPAVWLNVKTATDCVYIDELWAGQGAVAHLIGLGHQRIAFYDTHIPQRSKIHYSESDRERGYEVGMANAGLMPRFLHPNRREPAAADMAQAVEALRAPERPTAIITYSPEDLTMFVTAAAAVGLRIPQDLSLLTFTDEGRAGLGREMTYFKLPWDAMGRAAVGMLLRKIEQPDAPVESLALRSTLVPGGMCAAP